MDEQVLGLVIGRDEAKALLVAEPLDGSGSHLRFLLRSLVLRAPRLLSKSYDRWHCDIGRITRPDLATVAAPAVHPLSAKSGSPRGVIDLDRKTAPAAPVNGVGRF